MCTSAALTSQRAALALLENAEEISPPPRAARSRSGGTRSLPARARESWGREPRRPDGAFYWWTPLPAGAGSDDLAFATKLRDEGRVVTTPGFAFGPAGRGHLRVSFAAKPELVAEGARRMAPFFANA
jgi:aspartate/methionine/tyrosine aminotransferase